MPYLARPCRFACRLLLLAGSVALLGIVKAQSPAVSTTFGMQASSTAGNAAPRTLASVQAFVDRIDPRAVQLSWRDRRWLLVHQGNILKDFGSRVEDARLALRLIHELGLNERCVIGSPVPHLEYWLVDGHAPGLLPRSGMHTYPIEPSRLRVEQVQNQWCIRDANRVLFNFAQYADEAREALAVLQKYHFTQVGIVGQGMPSMIVFGGNGQGDTASLAATHGASAVGRQFAGQKFPRLAKNGDGSARVEPMKPGTKPSGSGYEGIVQPLVPPLAAPANVRAAPVGETPTLGNLRSVAFHSQPHFGPQAPNRATAPSGQQDRLAFDWRQLQVKQENGAWKLVAGSQVFASFGADLQQAQMALSAIRYYRFNELRAVAGGDNPPCFLAYGASPRGLMLGLRGVELQPDKLDVQRQPEGYAICQGTLVILQFGDRPEPARQTLEAIQRQKLDRVCHIGEQGKWGVTILVKSR